MRIDEGPRACGCLLALASRGGPGCCVAGKVPSIQSHRALGPSKEEEEMTGKARRKGCQPPSCCDRRGGGEICARDVESSRDIGRLGASSWDPGGPRIGDVGLRIPRRTPVGEDTGIQGLALVARVQAQGRGIPGWADRMGSRGWNAQRGVVSRRREREFAANGLRLCALKGAATARLRDKPRSLGRSSRRAPHATSVVLGRSRERQKVEEGTRSAAGSTIPTGVPKILPFSAKH